MGTGSIAHAPNLALFDEKALRRALYFCELLSMVSNVDGAVVECGVGQGRGLAILCSLTALEKKHRTLWAFDSFEGFPQLSAEDRTDAAFENALSEYKTFDVAYVYKTLLDFGISRSDIDRRIAFAKGFIPDSLNSYDGNPIALLHIDLDIYESYKAALEFFWENVSQGGVVAFDEYNKPLDVAKWPGASKAVNQFLDSRDLRSDLVKDSSTGNVYIVKK